MIDIILLTGFLGAGKTTFLQRLLEAYTQHKLGIIVNDFGEINVDAKLIQKEGMEMLELSNGSIFCACIKSKFVNGLVEMSKMDLDYLLIEASGLSDPANMEKLLEDIQSQTTHPLRLFASVCIVDAEYFLDLVDVLPALAQQVGYADAVIVNKADLADEETLTGIAQRIDELNQGVGVYCTSYCRVEIDEQAASLGAKIKDARKERIPYMLVVGEREAADGTAAVRNRREGELGVMTVDQLAEKMRFEVDNKIV